MRPAKKRTPPFQPDEYRRKLTTLSGEKRKIVHEIARLFDCGEPLNIAAVQRRHHELIDAVYAVKPFWGWRNALMDAGIDCERIAIELLPRIECKMCGGKFSVISATHLRHKHACTVADYRLDYPDEHLVSEQARACASGFSRKTNIRARLMVPHWESLWTAQYTLDRLDFLSRHGYAMHEFAVNVPEPSLVAMARLFWGSWDQALRQIGLDPAGIRRRRLVHYRTRDDVIEAIQTRASAGLSLKADDISHGKKADGTLYRWAAKLFGGWPDALAAAGFDFSNHDGRRELRSYHSTDEIVRAIQKIHAEGLPLNSRDVNGTLRRYGVNSFGSWQKAIEAAGLSYDLINKTPRPAYPTQQDVMQEIRKRHMAGQALNSEALRQEGGMAAKLPKYGIRFCGSWQRALQLAGLDPKTIFQQGIPKYPTPESVLERIRWRRTWGMPINSGAVAVGPHRDPALFATARRFFGKWSSALAQAALAN